MKEKFYVQIKNEKDINLTKVRFFLLFALLPHISVTFIFFVQNFFFSSTKLLLS